MNIANNVELSQTLEQMYSAARNAESEKSVIQKSDDGATMFDGHKWQTLGWRTDSFKASNKKIRRIFLESVCEEFGGLSRIPREVLDVLNLGDFQLEKDVNGCQRVTSSRPLTSRRIKFVCEAIKNYKAGHQQPSTRSEAFFGTLEVPGYDELPENLRGEYRVWATRDTCLEDVGRLVRPLLDFDENWGKQTNKTVGRFLFKKCEAKIEELKKLGFAEAVKDLTALLKWQMRPSYSGEPASIKIFLRILAATDMVKSAESKIFEHVLNSTKGCSAKQQAFAFGQLLESSNGGAPLVKEFISRVLSKVQYAEGGDISFGDMIADMGGSLDGEQIKALANRCDSNTNLGFEAKHAFMSQYIALYKDDFERSEGRENNQYAGPVGNKYANITEALRIIKEFKTVLNGHLREDLLAVVAEARDAQEGRNEELCQQAIERYDKLKEDFEERKIQAQNKGETFTEKFEEVLYPITLSTLGATINYQIQQITGVSNHGDTNSAEQMLQAFDLYMGVVDDFILALEKDAAKGEHVMFDMLMEALNTSGCLQKRSSDIQDVHLTLVQGPGALVDFNRSYDVMQGMGAAIQMLQDGDANKKVEYAELVDKYVELMATRNPAGERVPGTTQFGSLLPQLQLKADSQVTITREFLMQKEIADFMIKGIYDGFIEPLAESGMDEPPPDVENELPPPPDVEDEPPPPDVENELPPPPDVENELPPPPDVEDEPPPPPDVEDEPPPPPDVEDEPPPPADVENELPPPPDVEDEPPPPAAEGGHQFVD